MKQALGKTAKLRVLVADDDTPFARRMSSHLSEHAFEVRTCSTIVEAKELVEFWRPDTVLIDLLLPETNALSLLKFIKSKPLKKKPKIVVMSKQRQPESIEQIRKMGADDYLVKPFALEDVIRVSLPEPEQKRQEPPSRKAVNPSGIKELHLINLFLKQALVGAGQNNGLHHLMRMINLKVNGIRTSLIQCVDEQTGMVLASNDNQNIEALPIRLRDYPEIVEAKKTLSPVIIANVRNSPLLTPVQAQMAATPYQTIVLFPVFRYGKFFAVMSIRLEQRDPLEIFYIEKFGTVCSQIISLAIASPAVMAHVS